MKYARTMLYWLTMVAMAGAQPTFEWNTSNTNSMEGHFVYVNSSGSIITNTFYGSGGSIGLGGFSAANGRKVFVIPALITGWQTDGIGIKDPFNTSLDEQIGPTFVPQGAPALPPVAGGFDWDLKVKWAAHSIEDATALGITDTLPFSVAVFSTAKNRNDGVPIKVVTAANSNYADSDGSVDITVDNVQYFPVGNITGYRIICGGKATVEGTGGTEYTATCNHALTGYTSNGAKGETTIWLEWYFD